ncbi:EAL domain-containing protein [Salinisphaera sp. SPP-AMP-43]|uniref:putative bifunctional diguanylate cyclase/phosphodiesterase n=1 Tax=Salinisphaera sp. SPP-AMP-43 TaxID=3121288 RepID=UPI003C6DC919
MAATQLWDELATGLVVLDAGNVILHANPAFIELLELAEETQIVGRLAIHLFGARFEPSIIRDIERLLLDHQASAITVQAASIGCVTLYIGHCRDNTRLVAVSRDWPRPEGEDDELAEQLDPLTGFGNRLMFDRCINRLAEQPNEAGPAAVLVLDLDRFKQVNDTLGHIVGDELLQLMANRLRRLTREDDRLIRLGGDEFAILQTSSRQPDGARGLAQRLTSVMARPFLIDGQQVDVSASVGVAMLGQGTARPADLLKHADLALYEAKHRGRSRYFFFEPSLEEQAMARRQLEVDLRRALGLRQFELVYQPQASTSSGCLSGFEALLRWVHPGRGRVSPATFIPVAEEIGEIAAIGAWVIRSACREAMTWADTSLNVAVNVSPIQFESDEIVATVTDALQASGLSPLRLELEITEGTLLSQTEGVMGRLWALHEMGVSIAMDDFGTGYASLSYLNSFPFSKIKIDKSFIQAEQSPRSQALISAILAMGASMDMATIAEGVETPGQYAAISESGCNSVQGYYIARPMPAAAVADYLQSFDPAKYRISMTTE